jgi:hypothetical protein
LELEQLAGRIEQMDGVIQKTAKENEACQRLTQIPGVGPVTATALIGAIGNGSAFGKGRALSAWMGIVPGEYSTGGKQKLLGISKRGNKYLRRLFVQGARSVLQQRLKQAPRPAPKRFETSRGLVSQCKLSGPGCQVPVSRVVSMGRRNTRPNSYPQVFQWLNSFRVLIQRKHCPV